MPSKKTQYCIRIIVDILLLIAVFLPVPLLYYIAYPFKRGFFCDKERIRYPYKGDTISSITLFLVGTLLPIFAMCIVEFFRARNENIGKQVKLFGKPLNSWFWAVYSSVGVFLFGCACTQLFTDIGKYSLGLLRPHFIAVCDPDWSKTNCSTDPLSYVDPIFCRTSDDDKTLKDARQSFPSGHASFSAFTMVYLMIYLQMRLHVGDFRLLKPVLQLLCFFFTFYTCLTRISDYKHHWEDVVGGFILGSTIAVVVSVYIADLCSKRLSRASKGQVVVLQEYQQTATEDFNSSPRVMTP